MTEKTNESGKKPGVSLIQKNRESILATAAGGLCIALASVLSIIKLYEFPQGGSITPASMLPILFFALAFGPSWGIGVALVYGTLQFILSPFAAHWLSIFLDYPLAFGALGLAGFFAASRSSRLQERNILQRLALVPFWRIVVASLCGIFGRLVFHVISGVVFYASYAEGSGHGPLIYSVIYNGTYMVPEAIICIVILVAMGFVLRLSGKNRKAMKH